MSDEALEYRLGNSGVTHTFLPPTALKMMRSGDLDGSARRHNLALRSVASAGYRIGPGPIEDCLMGHPAVSMAAVVGVPDAARTEIVKAFIVLNAGFMPSDDLARNIQDYVKTRLAAHEYPRAVSFVDSLPLTATGKIMRKELRSR